MRTAFRAQPVDSATCHESSPGRYLHGYPKMGALTPFLLLATQSSAVRAVQCSQSSAVQSEQCQRDVFLR